jgi:hypothetical protein
MKKSGIVMIMVDGHHDCIHDGSDGYDDVVDNNVGR